MGKIILQHDHLGIPLEDGETLVGRSLDCKVRFNDPAVSRHHLRLIVRSGQALVENLSKSNISLLNGESLKTPQILQDGDVVKVGYQTLTVKMALDAEPDTISSRPRVKIATASAEEETSPTGEEWKSKLRDPEEVIKEIKVASLFELAKTPPRSRNVSAAPNQFAKAVVAGTAAHNCPRCRVQVKFIEDTCRACGYVWPPGRPSSRTQEIDPNKVAMRAHPRFRVEVPVVYSSENLTIEALVRDVSKGGMFIASDLLDPQGTLCEITALPNGFSAVTFQGEVAHVSQEAGIEGRPVGLGIKFIGASPQASAWLESLLAQFAASEANR